MSSHFVEETNTNEVATNFELVKQQAPLFTKFLLEFCAALQFQIKNFSAKCLKQYINLN